MTLAEILRSAGYRTLSVAANAGYVTSAWGFDQGFEYFDARGGITFLGVSPQNLLRDRLRRYVCRLLGRDPDAHSYRMANEITDEAVAVLKDPKSAGRPVFLFLNYMDAHDPVSPPAPFDHMFPGNTGLETFEDFERAQDEISNFKRQPTGQERARWISAYDGAIAYMDAHIGRLFDQLRQLHLYDDSLIIVTSDHGNSWRRSMVGHALGEVYQNLVHVPLMIKLPGQQASSTVPDAVSLIDIMPTILGTLQMKAPPALQGVDLNHPEDGQARRTLSCQAYPASLPNLRKRFDHIDRSLIRGSPETHRLR